MQGHVRRGVYLHQDGLLLVGASQGGLTAAHSARNPVRQVLNDAGLQPLTDEAVALVGARNARTAGGRARMAVATRRS